MKKFSILLALIFVLASCSDADDIKKEEVTTTSPKIEERVNPVVEQEKPAVTEKDFDDEKFSKTMDEVHAMKKDGMDTVNSLYTDLTFVKDVAAKDPTNLAGMWDEKWLYSKSEDVTVIVCNALNTPAFIFKWNNLSASQLVKVKAEMKKMMDDMESMGSMKDWDHSMWMGDTKKDMKEATTEKKMEKTVGSYTDYSEEAFKKASWKKVLFFHATWCPSCKSADKNLKADTIADGLTIFKVDYDSNTDLRKKYGVVAQHTFVYVDNNMEKIKLMVGGRNSADIVSGLLK